MVIFVSFWVFFFWGGGEIDVALTSFQKYRYLETSDDQSLNS